MDLELEPAQYAEGTRVLGADGRRIGEVVAAHRRHLIVERGFFFPTSYFVPFEAVAHAEGGDIVLAMTTAEALAQGWEVPPADPITEVVPAAPLLPNPTPDPTFPAPETAAAWRPATSASASASASSAPQPKAKPAQAGADRAAELEQPAASEPEGPAATTAAAPVAAAAETGAPAIEPAKPEPTELIEAPLTPPEQELASPVKAAKAAEAAPPAETAAAADAKTVAPEEAASIPVPSTQIEVAAVEPAAEAQDQQKDALSEALPAETQKAAAEPETPFGLGAPSIVPIPGRRLTDAELWALLDPKAAEGEAGDESGADGDASDSAADTKDSKTDA